jgi:hypothetical protein
MARTKYSDYDMYGFGYIEDGNGGWIIDKDIKPIKPKIGSQIPLIKEELNPRSYQGGLAKDGSIFIPGLVYSSKNSKEIRHRNLDKSPMGRIRSFRYLKSGEVKPVGAFIASNQNVHNYVQKTAAAYQMQRKHFLKMIKNVPKPYFVQMKLVRNTKLKWDFGNMTQLISDLMTKHSWIDDDDITEMIPIPPLPLDGPVEKNPVFLIHKPMPGVLIKVINFDEYRSKNRKE